MEINNITLNYQDKYYMFYDWLKTDDIKEYSNILLIKVNTKTLNDFINNKFIINETKFFNKNIIFTDNFSYIAINFNNEGISSKKSSILFSDEEKIDKKIIKVSFTNIKYKIINKEMTNKELRINTHIKNVIDNEIKNMFLSSNIDKIKYIYYEWFNKEENNLDIIKKRMYQRLNKNISNEEKRVYDLIESINK